VRNPFVAPRIGLCSLVSALALVVIAAPSTRASEPQRIGRASEIDTFALRRLIENALGDRGSTPVVGRRIGLDEAIETALVHNLRLQTSRLDRDIAERRVPEARARFHPTPGVTLSASETTFGDSIEVDDVGNVFRTTRHDENSAQLAAGFVRQDVPTGGSFVVSIDALREEGDDFGGDSVGETGIQLELRQPLMRGGRVFVARREIEDAYFDLGVFESRLRAEILQVTADVKEAYYNTIVAERLIEVSQRAIERDQALIEASEALFNAGRASQRDIVSAQIRLSDNLADLAERQALLERAQLSLRDVLGVPIGETVGPAESTVPFQPVELTLHEWIERALTNRPEIQEIRYRLEQSQLAVRVASNDVLPTLDLVGLYRRGDSDPTFGHVSSFGSQSWGAGIEFEIPFGNVAARERYRGAQFTEARIERELADQRRIIELQVRDETIGLRRNLAVLSAQTSKVEQARSKLEIAQVRYTRGLANNLDVIDAQRDLVDAETDLLAAIVDYTNGLARLEARIGGPL
jgi:outer membrane protein TolC